MLRMLYELCREALHVLPDMLIEWAERQEAHTAGRLEGTCYAEVEALEWQGHQLAATAAGIEAHVAWAEASLEREQRELEREQ